MKRLLFKLILVIVISIVPLSLLNHFYVSTYGFKQLNGIGKFEDIKNNLEVVNLGSSHGEVGFIYENLDGFNFGLSSQNLYYDFEILQKFSENLSNRCIVLIPISFFSFGFSMESSDPLFIAANPRYYRILDGKNIKNFCFQDFILYNACPILAAKENMKYLIRDKQSINENSPNYSDFIEDSLEASERHNKIANNLIEYDRNIQYLKNIVNYCKENDYVPILIMTPFTESYYTKIPKSIRDNVFDILEDICQENEIQFLNYSQDARFSKNTELFFNSDHLNEKGAAFFSQIVISELKKQKLLNE